MARPPVKGERTWYGVVDPKGVHDRTIVAIVANISADDGFITLDFDGLPSSGRPATVPWLWASFPVQGQGAWGRYMPFPTDVVKVSFDYDDSPRIVGYDTKANSPDIADGKAGWPKIKRAAASGTLPRFQPLKSGEFDFMSIGGAYIFGSATGQLTLAAGPATITITKSTNALQTEATQYTLGSGYNKIRFGQVRRTSPTSPGEVAGTFNLPDPTAVWNPDGSASEFQIQLYKTIGAVATAAARMAMGTVTSDSGINETGTDVSGNRKFVLEVFDPTGLVSLGHMEMVNDGSVAFGSALATAFKVNMPSATAEVKTAHVNLGLAPSGGAVEGATLGTVLKVVNTVFEAALASVPAAGGPPAQISALCAALKTWADGIATCIQQATSNTVKVTL
jgi:hypothetical protein